MNKDWVARNIDNVEQHVCSLNVVSVS